MINLSSAMGGQFAWSAAELTAEIKRMGPNPLRENGTNKSGQNGSDNLEQIEKESNGIVEVGDF